MSAPTLQHLTPRLKLRHFALLAELERQRSVSRAAEHMGLSQPTVTRALGEIENIFMTPLFTRSRRGLEPTAAGLLVLARARVALADAQSLGQDLAALGTGLQGRLRIGVLPFLARATQDAVWRHLLAVRPRLGFVVEEATTHVLVQAVRARTLDCAICRFTSASAEAGLAQEFLYTQEPRLVVSRAAAQRLARRGLDWEAFVSLHWIFPPEDTPIRQMIHSIFASAGQPVPVPLLEAYAQKTLVSVLRLMPDAITILPDDIAQEVADASGARVMPQRLQWNLPPVGVVRLHDAANAGIVDEMTRALQGIRQGDQGSVATASG
ncbi:LysR family transcriptional regulator [Variovorax sp. RKNM96]|uniref:LysR family transcriptional regulator n=1 Tax=Variovorax sp. RKNM96 TaxID=2681552 RepID=UPI001980761F|nr:LysR family transcriptional regulator [Variovorax sp. RKNM96]QSI32752.1 LysR family transcriptional regulator [Variovorax sp. RKNM96]